MGAPVRAIQEQSPRELYDGLRKILQAHRLARTARGERYLDESRRRYQRELLARGRPDVYQAAIDGRPFPEVS